MCVVPKRFLKDSFIINLLKTIEDKTGWKDMYGEYVFVPIESIPPRFHYPSTAEINNAVGKTSYMINLLYKKPLENEEDAKIEFILSESIFLNYESDVEYAAYSVISLAQIIALRNPVTAFYLGMANQTPSKKMLGTNLWKIILDIAVNMFLNNLRDKKHTADIYKEVMKKRMDELGDKFLNFITEKSGIQLNKIDFKKTQNPVLDDSNPWTNYFNKLNTAPRENKNVQNNRTGKKKKKKK